MMYYLAVIAPLIAGVLAVYGIFPDAFKEGASGPRKFLACVLTVLGIGASVWAAHAAGQDQKYRTTWQAVEDIHDDAHSVWEKFISATVDPARMEEVTKRLLNAQDLISKGQFPEANAETDRVMRLMNPDKAKLKQLVGEVRALMNKATQSAAPSDLQYKTALFCITVETLTRLHSSDMPMSPSLLFGVIFKDTRDRPENHLQLAPGWSALTWYTSFFQPSDFGPPKKILSVSPDGQLIIDSTKFDEDFLFSRANHLLELIDTAAR